MSAFIGLVSHELASLVTLLRGPQGSCVREFAGGIPIVTQFRGVSPHSYLTRDPSATYTGLEYEILIYHTHWGPTESS